MALTREQQIAALEKDWAENPRWKGVTRAYSAADVVRLRGSVQPEHTFAKLGAEKLWNLVTQGAKPSFRPDKDFVNCMGALTGVHSFLGGYQYFAAHVAAFLHRGQLVFKVHAGSACLDHALHQFIGVQYATETGFGVSHD